MRTKEYKGKGKGSNPNSKKALAASQVKKGDPARPGAGRPKGALSLREKIQEYLKLDMPVKLPDGTITDKTVLDGIVLSLLSKAHKGDMPAIKETFDRGFGKEVQIIETQDKEKTAQQLEYEAELIKNHEREY